LKRILIVTISHKAKDVRLYHKLGKSLSERYQVSILHNQSQTGDYDDDIKLIGLNNLSKTQFLIQAAVQIALLTPDVAILVEPILLTLVNPIAKTKYVYDCHEFFNLAQKEKSLKKSKQFLDTFLHQSIERRFIPKLSGCITVNDILTQKYQAMGTNTITIANYPQMHKQEQAKDLEIKYDFVYAGGLSPIRGIKEIIQATYLVKQILPEIKVLLVGKEQISAFRQECLDFIEELNLKNNISLLEAIPYEEVYDKYYQAKCGICLLSPSIARYKYALPIKLLEYLDAGLLVITNDFPMTKQISQSSEGILTAKFNAEDLANKMLKISTMSQEVIAKHKSIASKLIKEKYNWQLLAPKLLKFFEHLTSPVKKALLVSYFFPPLGGAGVQRPLKLTKYANESNWDLLVLTIQDIVFHSYDQSLLQEIESEVVRADSWDIMSLLQKIKVFQTLKLGDKVDKAYFETEDFKKKLVKSLFFMDEKIGWFIPAVLKGLQQVVKHDFSAVIVTIYPPSSLLIAYTIAKITNLPLFIDYRDHWTLSSYFDFSSQTSRQAYHGLEKFFLNQARGIITIGQVMKEELAQSFKISLDKIAVSYNGYDDEDFDQASPRLSLASNDCLKAKKKINIGYIGNMYKHRTSKYFLQALQSLIAEDKLDINEIQLNFMGNYYHEEQEVFKNSGLENLIHITPQQDHKRAIKTMQKQDILLLLIATKSGKNVLTGKIFEYLKSKKAILALVPQGGEAQDLLTKLGNPWIAPLEDIEQIKTQILEIIDFVKDGGEVDYDISQYSRKQQVKNFFAFIEEKI
jgi:glycosyltransferase involved in cell wall biosynthesis